MATRTLRKRKAPAQKPAKRRRTSPPEPKPVKKQEYPARCYIKDMPNEIMGLIFGCLNLYDLANMLCISKWVNSAFHSSMLFRQLKLVLDGAEEQLTSIVSQTKNNPLVYLSVQDILDAFTSQLCDCGEYGWYVFWFNTPPKRVCKQCMDKPEYHCAVIGPLVRHFRLKKADYAHVPTIKARSSINHTRYWHCAFPFPDNSVLVQRSVIEKIAEGKGIRPKKEFPHVVWCIMHDWDRPGIVKVPIFDLQRGLILYPLICGNCERESNGYAFKYEPLAYTVIPHDYEFLKKHVTKHHPEILDAFEGGWQKLDHQSQDMWLQEGRSPPPPDHDPSQWHSWSFVRYQQYQEQPKVQFECEDLHQELTDIVRGHMSHSGAIYGMPAQKLKEREKSPQGSDEEDELEMYGEEEREEDDDDNEGVTKEAVAEQAATAILNAEMPRFIERIRREFREKGLDAVYEWYPADVKAE